MIPFLTKLPLMTKSDNFKQSGQWLDCDDFPKHFSKPKLHQQKIMVTVWWSETGVTHYKFLETNQSITVINFQKCILSCKKRGLPRLIDVIQFCSMMIT